MEKYSRKKILIMLGMAVGFILIVVVISIVMMFLNQKRYRIAIDNLNDCSVGISENSKDNLYTILFNIIKNQNEVEEKKTQEELYHAYFRSDTCKTTVAGEYKFTSGILDIENAGYSYKIEYYWVEKDPKEGIDLGTVTAVCLKESELKYGSFNCADNSLTTTEFDSDIILRVTPYIGDGFTIYPRVGKKEDGTEYYYINIEYKPSDEVYINDRVDSFKASRKQMAIDYLTDNGVTIDNYPIVETFWYLR